MGTEVVGPGGIWGRVQGVAFLSSYYKQKYPHETFPVDIVYGKNMQMQYYSLAVYFRQEAYRSIFITLEDLEKVTN